MRYVHFPFRSQYVMLLSDAGSTIAAPEAPYRYVCTAWHMFYLDSHGPVRCGAEMFAQMEYGGSEADEGAASTS